MRFSVSDLVASRIIVLSNVISRTISKKTFRSMIANHASLGGICFCFLDATRSVFSSWTYNDRFPYLIGPHGKYIVNNREISTYTYFVDFNWAQMVSGLSGITFCLLCTYHVRVILRYIIFFFFRFPLPSPFRLLVPFSHI